MPHTHTKPGQHDHTVTAFIVRVDLDELRALVHMHRKYHKLLPVGGHVELNETPWQAMVHEIHEESGYAIDELVILQPTSRLTHQTGVTFHPYPLSMNTHALPDNHFHSDVEYGFIAGDEPSGSVADGESADLRWLTQSELNQQDNMNKNTKEIYNFIFDTALKAWAHVATETFTR